MEKREFVIDDLSKDIRKEQGIKNWKRSEMEEGDIIEHEKRDEEQLKKPIIRKCTFRKIALRLSVTFPLWRNRKAASIGKLPSQWILATRKDDQQPKKGAADAGVYPLIVTMSIDGDDVEINYPFKPASHTNPVNTLEKVFNMIFRLIEKEKIPEFVELIEKHISSSPAAAATSKGEESEEEEEEMKHIDYSEPTEGEEHSIGRLRQMLPPEQYEQFYSAIEDALKEEGGTVKIFDSDGKVLATADTREAALEALKRLVEEDYDRGIKRVSNVGTKFSMVSLGQTQKGETMLYGELLTLLRNLDMRVDDDRKMIYDVKTMIDKGANAGDVKKLAMDLIHKKVQGNLEDQRRANPKLKSKKRKMKQVNQFKNFLSKYM